MLFNSLFIFKKFISEFCLIYVPHNDWIILKVGLDINQDVTEK